MYNDSPIKYKKHDKLNRTSFAESIAKSILNIRNRNNSIVIGIMGGWGTGKSSLLNLIEYDLKNQYVKRLRFNPWNYYSQQALFTSFFDELIGCLSLNDKISALLQKYKYKILSSGIAIGSVAYPQINYLDSIIPDSEYKTLNSIKDKLDDIFRKHEKVVVIIDDIDRLNPTEVKQIFQLVKSLADFPNLIYILAFDKEYVNYALKDWNAEYEHRPSEEFIDKIIQVPLTIPKFDDEDLFKIFKRKFNAVLNNHNPDTENLNISKLYLWLCPYFKNIREINRFCNALDFYLYSMDDKIWIHDFALITALQVFEKDVYDIIKYNKNLLTGEFNSINALDEELQNHYKKDLNNLLKSLFKNNKLKKEPAVRNILSDLFPKVNNIEFNSDTPNSIIEIKRKHCGVMEEEYFDLYFTFDSTNKLSKSLIKTIISSIDNNNETLNNDLLKIKEIELLNPLIDNLKYHSDEFSENMIINLIETFITYYKELFADENSEPDNGQIEKAVFAIFNLYERTKLNEEIFVKTILECENNYFKTYLIWEINSLKLVNNELISELRKNASEYLKDYFETSEFSEIEHIRSFVWIWRDLSDFKTTDEYIQNLEDPNLIIFISEFMEKRFNEIKVRYDYLNKLVKLDCIKMRFEKMVEKNEKIYEENKSIINLFLKNYPEKILVRTKTY